jgi:type IV fimbrial biogenesis protein FimT
MSLHNKQSGFTLIEMMIVIAIMGIFAGIAIPNFLSYMPKHRLNGAARQVMGDLMLARMQAVSQNTTVTVAWVSDRKYKISTEEKTINYSDVTMGGFTDISFSPRGTATNRTITLTNSTGLEKKVTVAMTGRVKIE